MNPIVKYTVAINLWLPDSQVLEDLKKSIECDCDHTIEFEEGNMQIDKCCDLEVIAKAFVEQRYDVGFGSCFRADIAVGGVTDVKHGVVRARHCFATMWYNTDLKLITIDFYKNSL